MKTKIYFILFFVATFFSSCQKKDCTQGTTTYNISSDDKSKIPYNGKDTLTFVRTIIGDTFTFYGTGWQSGTGISYTAEDCPQKQVFEIRQLIFQSPNFSNPISISIYVQNVTKSTFIDIGFQNTVFENTDVVLSPLYDLDSTIIQGKKYYGIMFLNDLDSATPTTYNCCFNIQFGILKLFFANGETWELISKK